MLGGHVNRGREASQRKGAAGGAVLESFAVEAWQQRGALNIYPQIHREMVVELARILFKDAVAK